MDTVDHLPKLSWKIVIIGDEGTGKTSLVRHFVTHQFDANYLPTLGMNISVYTLPLEIQQKKIEVRYNIWDLGGQPAFRSIYTQFFLGTNGVLLLFDLTRENIFTHIPEWLRITDENHISRNHILLIGNKSDLTEKIIVSPKQIYDLQISIKIPQYFVTSAVTGAHIPEAFETMGKILYIH